MTLTPLLTASLETALNHLLYRDRGLKAARQRLNGRSLAMVLAELKQPIILIFSEQQVDVIGEWSDTPDCTVKTRLATLSKLRDRQQLTSLIRSGELEVEGDLQVVQQFSALLDLAELDPAEYLAPGQAMLPLRVSPSSSGAALMLPVVMFCVNRITCRKR